MSIDESVFEEWLCESPGVSSLARFPPTRPRAMTFGAREFSRRLRAAGACSTVLCSGRVWRLAPTFFPLCNICLRHVPLDVEMYVHAGCETVDPDSGLLTLVERGRRPCSPD